MEKPIELGAFPAEDEPGVVARVTKAQAEATAQIALEGLDEGDYAKWTTSWSDGMRDAIPEGAFHQYLGDFTDRYGRFESLDAMRLTSAAEPGYVRYWALAAFERGHVLLIHVYPQDGDRIVGVHLRDAVTGE